jgi:hypothetical protein
MVRSVVVPTLSQSARKDGPPPFLRGQDFDLTSATLLGIAALIFALGIAFYFERQTQE